MGGGSNGPAYYPGTLTHFIVGVGVCFGSAPSATHYASFTDNSGGDSNVNLYLSAAADGSLGLGCSWGYGAYGSDTHWGSTAAGVIADFTAYNYIELEYLVASSGGSSSCGSMVFCGAPSAETQLGPTRRPGFSSSH